MATISSLSTSLVCFCLATLGVSASAGEMVCPPTQAGARLVTVTLFDGPPSEHADLVPDRYRKTKDGGRSEWDVAYVYAAGRKLFVECRYGAKVAPVVIEPAPTATQCAFVTRSQGRKSLSCVSATH